MPEPSPQQPIVTIEVLQADGIEAFACYISPTVQQGKAIIGLNIAASLAAAALGEVPKADLPYLIAEHLMHEVVHVLEEWAGVEFNEERVEALIAKYREAAARMPDPEEGAEA